MREVITHSQLGWADWNYALTARCWLAVGKGEVSAELLPRLGDRDSWRVAALFKRETGRVGGGMSYRLIESRGHSLANAVVGGPEGQVMLGLDVVQK